MGTLGQRYKLLGAEILVKEEISGNVEVRKKSNRVMAIVLILDREVMQIICVYGPQTRRPDTEKFRFYNEGASEWELGSSCEIIISLGDFNGHMGKCAEGFEGVHRGNDIGKRNAKGRLPEFFDEKELCVANTWFY